MEIEPSNSHLPIRGPEPRPVRRSANAPADAGEFRGADALRQALIDTPDIRPDVVERGRALVSTGNYPPPEALDRLARLFALGFGAGPAASESV